jgi:hypothetical protein
LLKPPRQLRVDFEGHDLQGSRRQELGHRSTPCADLQDQVIGLDREAVDDPPLKPPVAEEMLAKLGTSRLGHRNRFYLKKVTT